MSDEPQSVKEIRQQIADLKKRWPAHSVPPALLQQLDDLEEELERALRTAQGPADKGHQAPDPRRSDPHALGRTESRQGDRIDSQNGD